VANGKEITAFALNTLRGLTIAAVLGMLGVAGTQRVIANQVTTNKETLERNQPVIDSVDVLKAAVADLEKDLEKLDKKMDNQHNAVIDAIKDIRR